MKRFCLKALIYYLPLMLLCYLGSQATGDIGRLAGIRCGRYAPYEYPSQPYHNNYITLSGLDTCGIIAMGDSYTMNPWYAWYQYYIEHELQQPVRTIGEAYHQYAPFAMAHKLMQGHRTDGCQVMIVEVVERNFIGGLIEYPDNDLQIDSIRRSHLGRNPVSIASRNPSDERVTLQYVCNHGRHLLKLQGTSLVSLRLDRDFFSNKRYQDLLSMWDLDIKSINKDTAEILQARENLLQLKQEADEKGIFLIVMTAANRYNLYYDYIVDNPYPKDYTMDFFADMDTSWFLNTTQLLKPYVDRGEKDIVLLNDTHWSLKAAKIVGEKLADMIRNHQENRQE